MSDMICDCGHKPSECSLGTGYGKNREGLTKCYDCCTEDDKKALLSDEKIVLYISMKDHNLVNWPGRILGKVLFYGAFHPFSRERQYIRVKDCHGQEWYGTGAVGMWASLKKCKRKGSKVANCPA